MSSTQSRGKRPVFSSSSVLAELGDALTSIKAEDRLSWDDMAAVLGCHRNQAARYADGQTAMSVVTFYRAKREWNGRFTRKLDELCAASRPAGLTDRAAESKVLKAALALSIALEDDDEITPDEIVANRATIENARDALDSLLAKLTPRRAG